MAKFEAFVPPHRRALYDAHGYSAAVRVGDLLFVSGQVGVDEHGQVVPDSRAQIEQAFDNLGIVLELAGCGFQDVVTLEIFLVDLKSHIGATTEIKQRYFPAPPYPALTGVEVKGLAMDGLIFEIKATAHIPRGAETN